MVKSNIKKGSMKQICLLLLGAIISFQLSAQSTFKRGRVISLSGDTISGEIDYQSYYKLSKVCNFRTSKSAKTQRFSTNDIKGFILDEKAKEFERARLHYYGDSITAFVEKLVVGKMSLFSLYETAPNQSFYIKQKDKSDYVFLPFQRSERLVDNGYTKRFKTVSTINHIDSLKKYMADVSELKSDIDKIEIPTQNNITNIVAKYNLLSEGGNAVVVETKKTKEDSKLYLEPVIGLSDFKNTYFNRTDLNLGCRIMFPLNLRNENLLLSSGMFVRLRGKDVNYLETIYDDSYYDVKVPLLLEYRFSQKLIQPRFSVGPTVFITKNYLFVVPTLNAGLNYNITDRLAASFTIYSELYGLSFSRYIMTRQNDFGGLIGIQLGL